MRDVVWAGTAVISAGGDQKLIVSGAKQYELLGNMSGVKDLALSPDGTLVAAAGIDGTARVWPVAGGEPRAFRGHRASVKAVAFTGDGTMLISASDDDRVRLWPLAKPGPAPTGPALAAWIQQHTNVR